MDIIEHNEEMEKIIAKNENSNQMIESYERKYQQFLEETNKMHALMSDILTPLTADFWRNSRIKTYRL
jgi:dsDNA-specific endonuclease/ATPase MutS2